MYISKILVTERDVWEEVRKGESDSECDTTLISTVEELSRVRDDGRVCVRLRLRSE